MKTPDVSAAQIVAALSALATALVVLFKLPLTDVQQGALATIIGTVVPTAWIIADSIIRHGRSNATAAAHNLAAAQIQNLPPDGVDRAPAAPVS